MVVRLRFVNPPDPRVRHRRQIALCAMTAARRLATGEVSSVRLAAWSTGSTAGQVYAAVIILKAEDDGLLQQVLAGKIGLAAAARQIKPVADLVSAYRHASERDLMKAAKTIGAELAPTTVAAE